MKWTDIHGACHDNSEKVKFDIQTIYDSNQYAIIKEC